MKPTFIISLTLLVFTSLISSCSLFCKKGDGSIITEKRTVTEFDELDIGGQAVVFLEQGSPASVSIKIDSNLMEHIKTEVSGMKLKIKEDKCLEEITEFEVYITTANISKLYIDGAVKIKGENTIRGEKLYIKNESSGEVTLNLEVDDLETVTKGSGLLKLMGRVLNFDIEVEAAGSVDAFGLLAKDVDADVSGAGTCKINVSEEFDGNVSGSGKIYYKGNPKKVQTDASGSGTIQAK
ncbi:MAG: DUF2807 domain-containing protein [Bacteroidales bacterium]|nr:DUF2807 domain-containing protein [Bacteroidales bacterium]